MLIIMHSYRIIKNRFLLNFASFYDAVCIKGQFLSGSVLIYVWEIFTTILTENI